jgi:hypothetical protein
LQGRGGGMSATKRQLEKSIVKESDQKKGRFSTPQWFQQKMSEKNHSE